MKCSQCDNAKLVKANLPLEGHYCEGWWDVIADVYLCLECGHYEIFSPNVAGDYKETIAVIKEKNEKYSQINSNLNEHKKNLEIKTNKLKDIESQLSSLDITIRQQQEFQKQVSDLKIDIKHIYNEVYKAEQIVANILEDIETKKKNFTNHYKILVYMADIFDENI